MSLRKCTDCGVTKLLVDFAYRNKAKGIKHHHCKSCHKEKRRAWYLENQEKAKLQSKAYYEENVEACKEARSIYVRTREGRAAQRFRTRGHEAGIVNNKTTKLERGMIASLLESRDRLAECLGVSCDLDHIEPLAVGGAHHYTNLQVATSAWNNRKGDKNSNLFV